MAKANRDTPKPKAAKPKVIAAAPPQSLTSGLTSFARKK
jgi:hypothetical protein